MRRLSNHTNKSYRESMLSIPVLICILFLATKSLGQSVDTGTIKGRLVWANNLNPLPRTDNVSQIKDPLCKSRTIINKDLVVDPSNRGVSYGIAYLLKPNGDFSREQTKFLEKHPKSVIGQKDCELVPYVSIVHEKQNLVFEMNELKGHHISVLSRKPVGRMLRSNLDDESSSLARLAKKEVNMPVVIQCENHPWMKCYIMNVNHPFAVVTKADGSFEINGIPPGEQQLIVWQPSMGYVNVGGNKGMKVIVPSGGAINVGEISCSK